MRSQSESADVNISRKDSEVVIQRTFRDCFDVFLVEHSGQARQAIDVIA